MMEWKVKEYKRWGFYTELGESVQDEYAVN